MCYTLRLDNPFTTKGLHRNMNKETLHRNHRETAHSLYIIRHGSTRHWEVWEGDELLAVTLHLKGARAIAHRLAPNTTPTEQSITLAARDIQGGNVRLMMSHGNTALTHVCHGLRGPFHSDYRCPASIPALLGKGRFTLRSATGQRKLTSFLNKANRRTLA